MRFMEKVKIFSYYIMYKIKETEKEEIYYRSLERIFDFLYAKGFNMYDDTHNNFTKYYSTGVHCCWCCKSIIRLAFNYTANGNLYYCGNCIYEKKIEILLHLPPTSKVDINNINEYITCEDCKSLSAKYHIKACCGICKKMVCPKCYYDHNLQHNDSNTFVHYNTLDYEMEYQIKKRVLGKINVDIIFYINSYRGSLIGERTLYVLNKLIEVNKRVINYYTRELNYIDKCRDVTDSDS